MTEERPEDPVDPILAGWKHLLDDLPPAGEVAPAPGHETTGRSERPVDVVSLVGGIVVLVLTLAFAFGDLDTFDAQAGIVWPTIVLGIGAAVLVSLFRR